MGRQKTRWRSDRETERPAGPWAGRLKRGETDREREIMDRLTRDRRDE